jgi:hypothetical protein
MVGWEKLVVYTEVWWGILLKCLLGRFGRWRDNNKGGSEAACEDTTQLKVADDHLC